jgi:hypothetical protein
MLDFYKTAGGRRFIDVTMPRIADALERILDILEKFDSNMRQTTKILKQRLEVKAESGRS